MGILAGDKIQVSFRGTCFGQRILMVRLYEALGPGVGGNSIRQDLQNINSELAAGGGFDLVTPYLACLPPQYTLQEIRSQVISPIRSAYEGVAVVGGAGTNVNPATVACDSAGIIVRTDLAGRKHRGTVKIGPIPDGASAAGLLTPAYKVLLTAVGSKLIQAFTPVGWGGTLVAPVMWDKVANTTRNLQTFLIPDDSRVMYRRIVGKGE